MTDRINNPRPSLPERIPSGMEILHDPFLNKGTAFTEEERDLLKIRGLLPPRAFTQYEQEQRIMENFRRKTSALEKYIFMIGLQDRNENLFYRTVIDNLEEMMPIIYTPTVGEACRQYAHIFRRPRGLYVSSPDRGRIAHVLHNWPEREIRVIVVTDGERILGLGDLGANGMGIPVGKLSLYSACAGISPRACLPVMLDIGTNNNELLNDPLYFGIREPRLPRPEYDEFVEEFLTSAMEVFPGAVIQFEDFANRHAFRLLKEYRERACVFNDDIQGTAAVALAGLMSATKIAGTALKDQVFLFQGAGAAAIGIADLLVSAMASEGLTETAARQRVWLVDSRGLVVSARDDLEEHKLRYRQAHDPIPDLEGAVRTLRPSVLIGVSGQPGSFTRPILEEMARVNQRPVIFALSNPTSRAECTAEQAYRWTDGGAIFASGSPFGPVHLGGRTFVPGQGNNAYIFPGLGLGLVVSGAERVTDEMFLRAAEELAKAVGDDLLQQGLIYPPINRIRSVSAHIAAAVARVAYEESLATGPRPDDLLAKVKASMYEPDYPSYVSADAP